MTYENYDSNEGMLTTVWGPPMWHTLHIISFNYPVHPTKKQKKEYYDYYNSMKYILPCGKCRENLKQNLKKHPLTRKVFKNRHTLSRWVYDLHETINNMLGKDSGLTYEKVRETYEHFRSKCSNKKEINKEKGCVNPLHGKKSKCVLKIVPQTKKCKTFQMDKQCKYTRKKRNY